MLNRIILLLSFVSLFALSDGAAFSKARIVTKAVEYAAGETKLKGYLAYDATLKGKRPAVLVVHEWWGLNDYARMRARMLAGLGYIAFAVDMYGGGRQAAHPDDAMKFSGEVMKNFETARARFQAAVDFIKKQPNADPERIAAVGYCFGGGVVLNVARHDGGLRAAVSFHGSLKPAEPAGPGTVSAKILVLNGADDPFTTADQIADFKKEMETAGVDYRFINYPGARHAFTNPAATGYGKKFKLPLAYNAAADKKSWKEMKGFLAMAFK